MNGDLCRETLRRFPFDGQMRAALLDACRFDWSNISPAIFGTLFQSVMEPAARPASGARYTTEKNIRKVTEPLLLDDPRTEFEAIPVRRGRAAVSPGPGRSRRSWAGRVSLIRRAAAATASSSPTASCGDSRSA